jgi:hypothetical protein
MHGQKNVKIAIWIFFENMSIIKTHYNGTRMKGTIHEGHCKWRVLYMKGTVHEGHCTWRALYMKGTVHEGHCTWRVLYMKGTVHEDEYKVLIICRSVTLRMRNASDNNCTEMLQTTVVQKCFRQQLYRNASDNSCTENRTTHFVFSTFFRKGGIMCNNIVERGRPQMTIWYMRNACWIPKATNTHSEYVILIAFPVQQ